MTALTKSGHITRDSLGLADLPIFDGRIDWRGGPGYEDTSFQPGQMLFNRRVAESDFLNGGVLVHATLAMRTMTVTWLVYGDDLLDCRTRVVELVTALWQPSWELHVTLNTAAYMWTCMPADTSVLFDTAHARGAVATVTALVPAQPDYV